MKYLLRSFLLFLILSPLNSFGNMQCGNCDLQSDGITIVDALVAAQISAGLVPARVLQDCSCDVDNSGTITILDSFLIANVVAGIQRTFDCPTMCYGSSAGEVWLDGAFNLVSFGDNLDLELNVNAYQSSVGAFHFDIYYDPILFEVDTTFGESGVLYHPKPSLGLVYIPLPGELRINGFFTYPPCPTGILSLATIRFKYIGSFQQVSLLPPGSAPYGVVSSFNINVDPIVDCDALDLGASTPRLGIPLNVVGSP